MSSEPVPNGFSRTYLVSFLEKNLKDCDEKPAIINAVEFANLSQGETANKIVGAIWRDLEKRVGLRDAIQSVDFKDVCEIKKYLASLIANYLPDRSVEVLLKQEKIDFRLTNAPYPEQITIDQIRNIQPTELEKQILDSSLQTINLETQEKQCVTDEIIIEEDIGL